VAASDSQATEPESVTSPGQPSVFSTPLTGTWGGLEILEPIGRGGFGQVYRARDPALARDVALKIIDVPSRDPARIADVLREGRLLARVRHTNVVTIYGAQESAGAVGIWMELIEGRSLADLVRRDGPMGPEEASVIGVSVCRAVAAVHGAGLVHRDVKAQNVMRGSGGRIVLMDFGAGLELEDVRRHGAQLPTGTPLYMAPELLGGQTPTPASDIYSLGVLLFFLVTGLHPVEGRTITDVVLAHGLGQRRLLSDVRPDLPDAFVKVVERALSGSPERRYATAGAMMRALVDAIPQSASPWQDTALDTPAGSGGPGTSELPAPADVRRGGTPIPAPALWTWTNPLAWLTGAVAVAGGIWILGLLTSLAFDLTLGRLGGFSHESALGWWIWGLRSLVAPAFYVVFTLGLLRGVGLIWRLLAWLRPVRTVSGRVTRLVRSATARMHLDSPAAAGQAILVVQIVVLVLFCWRFSNLIGAFTSNISTASSSTLAPLAPGNEAAHDAYRLVLPLIVLGMVLAWMRVWRWERRSGARGDRAAGATGLALVVLALLLLEFPYRILRHSLFLRVAYDSERCYVIGDRGENLLLYCPDAPSPRNKVVDAGDPRVERTTTIESIFTPPPSHSPDP
jgi:hypothetical protein